MTSTTATPAHPRVNIADEVRDAVEEIPPGRVASYGDIAARIGTGPRQVGRAMSLLGGSLPWWRVVHADGRPATCQGGTATTLLVKEGTAMRGTRVDMDAARHVWPSAPVLDDEGTAAARLERLSKALPAPQEPSRAGCRGPVRW